LGSQVEESFDERDVAIVAFDAQLDGRIDVLVDSEEVLAERVVEVVGVGHGYRAGVEGTLDEVNAFPDAKVTGQRPRGFDESRPLLDPRERARGRQRPGDAELSGACAEV